MAEYLLPDVGEGLTEAEIVAWKVKVGDVIAVNDIVVEIETAKSIVELPSPYAGTVTAILVEEGETVAVGTPIIAVGDPSETGAAPAARPAGRRRMEIDLSNPAAVRWRRGREPRRPQQGRPRPDASRPQGGRRHAGDPHADAGRRSRPGWPRPWSRPPSPRRRPATSRARPVEPAEARALAKPPVRKLAKDLGVDLASSPAPGRTAGVITRGDVEGSRVEVSPRSAAARRGERGRARDA